ncbi:MAG: tRNA (uridine(54)-C5)-methyltransferase TrmA [Halieaceae bacterium]|jgi:tRNA (uracil-5-)-methyltransferase|nr:tRNA (uridine(54)-C5)-methyltransferase TrmA [Halieaceae bacterium]
MRPWETQPEQYEALFAAKCAAVHERLLRFAPPPAERFKSPPDSYRVRAEFRIWHDGDELDYVMFDSTNPRQPVAVRDFAPALTPIRRLMPRLRESLRGDAELRRKLFQAEFLASRQGETLVTLIYHRPLDEVWEQKARQLAEALEIHLIGRSRKQKLVLEKDYIGERFRVGEREYEYRQYEQSFVQPNAPVNEQMLAWVQRQAAPLDGDLLELYCGNGNFTLPLAERFDRVIATELSKIGTRAARENIELNGVANVSVVRLSAEEVSAALAGEREFRRLRELPAALDTYDLRNVFVDPPRAGLDAATLSCVREFDTILYISCNPETLVENLDALSASHAVAALAYFDQFPYTPHLECGVVLKARRG